MVLHSFGGKEGERERVVKESRASLVQRTEMLDSTNPYARISKKWIGFVTAIWIQSIAGNNYTFANYSPELKEVLHYNQLQLNNLGVAKDVGKSFGLLAGLLADHLPTWAILLIGAVEGTIGYGTQYLVVAQKIGAPSYWQVGSNLAKCGREGLEHGLILYSFSCFSHCSPFLYIYDRLH